MKPKFIQADAARRYDLVQALDTTETPYTDSANALCFG